MRRYAHSVAGTQVGAGALRALQARPSADAFAPFAAPADAPSIDAIGIAATAETAKDHR